MSELVKAAVLREAPGEVEVTELLLDDPQPHEVVVRVAASGLCHSDLAVMKAKVARRLPMVLGHEVCGTVEKVGDRVESLREGDVVVACLSASCGQCRACLRGRFILCQNPGAARADDQPPRLSENGVPVQQSSNIGGFAEKVLVHERNLVRLEEDLPPEQLALMGCAVLTGVGGVVNRRLDPNSRAAVIGCGGVGLNVLQGLRLCGFTDIVGIDRFESKVAVAMEFGATEAVAAGSREEILEALDDRFSQGFDYVFESVGSARTAELAFELLAPAGTAFLVGVMGDTEMMSIPAGAFLRERTLTGLLMGSGRFQRDIPNLARLAAQQRIDVGRLISKRIDLHGINDAYRELATGKLARVVMTF